MKVKAKGKGEGKGRGVSNTLISALNQKLYIPPFLLERN